MINEKTITVKMKRIELCKLIGACTHLKVDFLDDADNAENDDARMIAHNSADMWASLHAMLKAQLEDFDRKREQDGQQLQPSANN